MTQPKVSIVMPIYNAEDYIEETLGYVLNQTYKNIEVICVNDGSTDTTRDILTKIQKKDSRIKVINQDNHGAGSARNHGLSFATGKYISFLDSDDIFERDMIKDLCKCAEKNEADVVVCRSSGYDELLHIKVPEVSGSLIMANIPEKKVFSGKDNRKRIFQMTAGWVWDKLYLREFLTRQKLKFPEDRKVCNDIIVADLAFALADRICIVDEFLVCHRTRRTNSLENQKDRNWKCHIQTLLEEQDELINREIYSYFKQSFLYRVTEYLVWYINTISDNNIYVEYYDYVKKIAFDKFLLTDNKKEDYLENPKLYENFQTVLKSTPKEYKEYRYNDLNATVYSLDCSMRISNYNIESGNSDISNLQKIIKRKMWRFPFDKIPINSKVIIYGYGDVGRDYYNQLKYSNCVKLVAISDKNFSKFDDDVIAPEEIVNQEFDYVVIAIENKKIRKEAIKNLIKIGIKKEQIF